MNEENLSSEYLFFSHERDRPFGSTFRDYEALSTLETSAEVEYQENLPIDMRAYKVHLEVLNSFLTSKFGKNLEEFMKMYIKERLKSLQMDATNNDINMLIHIQNIPPIIICYFSTDYIPFKVSFTLMDSNPLVIEGPYGSFPNLHDTTVCKFTLIHANFNLEEEKNLFSFGYHFKTDKYRFFIKSSSQLDLSIVYEEL